MAIGFAHLILDECFRSGQEERRPEPEAVMDEAEQVAAYTAAGRDAAVMAPTHLFHSIHACEVIRPGDRVLDLGCGPGTQLVQLAELNPDVEFLGVDLAERMLHEARAFAEQRGTTNVRFARADMTDLRAYPDASFDAVISSMTLHHLPEEAMLARCFAEVARVLKPDGGLYLADFARLRSAHSMHFFAYQQAAHQSPAFTRDYWNSLQAAFSVAQMQAAAAPLVGRARLHRMRVLGMMQAIKSPARRRLTAGLRTQLAERVRQLPPQARTDFKRIASFFRLGGMRTPRL